MASGTSRPSAPITGINVTPLVDITLVLLIVFMVTAKLIASPRSMNLDLPKAASGSEIQEIFSVVLEAGGALEVNGQVLSSDDDVLAQAQLSASKHADLRAVLKADGGVPHRRVMHVLDLLKQAGIAKIGFGVVPIPSATAKPVAAP